MPGLCIGLVSTYSALACLPYQPGPNPTASVPDAGGPPTTATRSGHQTELGILSGSLLRRASRLDGGHGALVVLLLALVEDAVPAAQRIFAALLQLLAFGHDLGVQRGVRSQLQGGVGQVERLVVVGAPQVRGEATLEPGPARRVQGGDLGGERAVGIHEGRGKGRLQATEESEREQLTYLEDGNAEPQVKGEVGVRDSEG